MTYTKYADLNDAVVLITGGASGIGRDIADAFAAQSARIGILDIDEVNGQVTEAALTAAGCTAKFVACDLRNISALEAAVATLEQDLGAATVLVNNAARDDRHGWEDVTEAYYDERIATNLRHMFFATKAVAPGMIAAGGGSIINMGSNSWWEAAGGFPVYTTAKAAIHGMTRSFARDLGKHHIRVNTVVPGWIMTDRQKERWVTPESLARHLERQCLPTPIDPHYVARMVLFLASGDAAMCTAQNYMVDAGSI
ncbi:MAG: SDR family oxidoreductase [Bacteroidota bacterium]